MKRLLILVTIAAGCTNSPSIEGLWIEREDQAILIINEESAIPNSFDIPIRDTLTYDLSGSTITWFGLNPFWNDGKTSKTYQYRLTNDSLMFWNDSDESHHYYRSLAANYLDHLLLKDGLNIRLPKAEQTRQIPRHYDRLKIRAGSVANGVRLFVEGVESNEDNINNMIEARLTEWHSPVNSIMAYLFIDEDVTMDYVFLIISGLRKNGITAICFVTGEKNPDPYTDDFAGLSIHFPSRPVNLIEEGNER